MIYLLTVCVFLYNEYNIKWLCFLNGIVLNYGDQLIKKIVYTGTFFNGIFTAGYVFNGFLIPMNVENQRTKEFFKLLQSQFDFKFKNYEIAPYMQFQWYGIVFREIGHHMLKNA